MKDSDWVMYTFNMLEIEKKEKEDAKKKKKFEDFNEDKSGKDQEGYFKKTLANKEKQKPIHEECKMQFGQVKWNQGNSSKSLMKERKNVDNHVQQEVSKNAMLSSNIIDLTIQPLDKNEKTIYKEAIQNERLEVNKESKKQKEQNNIFEEKIPENQQQQQQQQQQREYDINGETELNKVTCQDRLPNNFGHISNDSNVNYGSKLWTKDEKDGNYRIMLGIPRSIKFRSITNLYKCTDRISPVEDEYTWDLSADKDSNMNIAIKDEPSIITDEDNVGCKRKWRENQNANGEKDATTSST